MNTYEVPIVYHGQENFLVQADTPEEAEEIARQKFYNGDNSQFSASERIERFGEIELCEDSHREDCASRMHTAAECTCGKADKDALEAELRDAWQGEGNSQRVTFNNWIEAMANNDSGTLQQAAQQFQES